MDVLYAVRVFLAFVDTASFAKAARRMNTSTAAISRQIAALETHLSARLFNRTTRRLSLTDAGLEYAARVRTILDDIE